MTTPPPPDKSPASEFELSMDDLDRVVGGFMTAIPMDAPDLGMLAVAGAHVPGHVPGSPNASAAATPTAPVQSGMASTGFDAAELQGFTVEVVAFLGDLRDPPDVHDGGP